MHFYLLKLSKLGSEFDLNSRNYRGLLYGSLHFAIHRVESVVKPIAVYAEDWEVDQTELKKIKKRTYGLLRTENAVGLTGERKKHFVKLIEEASDLFEYGFD